MGSIKNNRKDVVITFEVERFLKEPLVMFEDGKCRVSTNITFEIAIAWALYKMLHDKIPELDTSKLSNMRARYDHEAGTFVVEMDKQST